jgi:hypothetical protein
MQQYLSNPLAFIQHLRPCCIRERDKLGLSLSATACRPIQQAPGAVSLGVRRRQADHSSSSGVQFKIQGALPPRTHTYS